MARVPDVAMRVGLWRQICANNEPDPIINMILLILEGIDRSDPDARIAFHGLLHAGWFGSINAQIAARCVERELPRVEVLFARLPEPPAIDPAALRTPPIDPNRVVTAGELVSWARRPDRGTIERLLFVPAPDMLDKLLSNPKLTETDVLRVASRRPYPTECLGLIFRHPRWGQRQAIQEALILNPHTELRVACGLVELLDGTQARRVARQPALHPLVRAAARRRAGD